MKTTALAAALLGVALIGSPAVAKESQSNSINIEYSDLDLSTPEGQAKLEQRIEIGARKMCDVGATPTGSRQMSASQRRCLTEARKSAKTALAKLMDEQQLGG